MFDTVNNKADSNITIINKVEELYEAGMNSVMTGIYDNIIQGIEVLGQALTYSDKILNNDKYPIIAKLLFSIGYSYTKLDGTENQAKALDLLNQSLKMRQELYGTEPHSDIAESLSSLGIYYRKLSDNENIQKALDFQEQAYKMRQELYGNQDHPDIVKSLGNIANIYEEIGGNENLSKSLSILHQILLMSQRMSGNKADFNTAIILNNLASKYQSMGSVESLKKGLNFLKESLSIYIKLYNQLHNDQIYLEIADTLGNIGSLYQFLSLQDANKSKEYLAENLRYAENSLIMLQKFCDNQPHSNLASSLKKISIVYIHMGGKENLEKADKLQNQALEMYKTLDENHSGITECLSNLDYIAAALQEDENANNVAVANETIENNLEFDQNNKFSVNNCFEEDTAMQEVSQDMQIISINNSVTYSQDTDLMGE